MRNKLGIIGFPLLNSLSPEIQRVAIKEFNLNLTYNCWPLNENELSLFINNIYKKESSILGFNVTIPYKEKIISLLDKLTENADKIGAVNTVKYFNGKLIGENTDGTGFINSLLNKKINFKNKKSLIIGTGGAAKGIAITLSLNESKKIDLVGRNVFKGKAIEDKIKKISKCKSKYYNLNDLDLINIGEYDLIIQTTPIKINFKKNFIKFKFDKLNKNQILIDITYNPSFTEYLKEGNKKGLKTMNGSGMLIEQGALSFEFWTGKKPNKNNMEKVLMNTLKNK